jgi:hypothetical protein
MLLTLGLLLSPAFARAATGYDLYVGHEFTPKGDAIAALKQAYKVMHV